MDMLAVVRHGKCEDYETDKRRPLTSEGVAETAAFAQRLKTIVESRCVKVLSSTMLRAVQSAEIIAEALGTKAVLINELAIDAYEGDLLDRAVQVIDREGVDCDVLVVVTHFETCAGIPAYFVERITKNRTVFSSPDNSEAHIVYCNDGNFTSNFR